MHRPVTGWRIELQNRHLNRPGLPATLFLWVAFCSNALLYAVIKQRFMLQTYRPRGLRCSGFRCPSQIVSGIGTLKSSQKRVPSLSPRDLFAFSLGPLDLTINTLRGSMSQVKLCERDVRHIV